MSKFQRSWLLFKSSVSVITRNKQLLVFPIVTFLLTLVIVAVFVLPVAFKPTGYAYSQAQHWQAVFNTFYTTTSSGTANSHQQTAALNWVGFAYLGLIYFTSMFFATFFNVAFMNEIFAALRGEAVSVARGLKFASTRLKPILMWTLLAGIVGLIVKAIEERLGWAGRIIAKLLGIAWSVACIFAIPVIVYDQPGLNPVAVLRKSATILRRTWGEALIGYAGLQFGGALVALGGLVVIGGGLAVGIMLGNFWLLAVGGLFWFLAVIAFAYLSSVAGQVYRGALFLYAETGAIAEPFNKEMLDMAWKMRK